jgi:murein DD-endopeptidase MepM/ murein hydrolase activator NlpD
MKLLGLLVSRRNYEMKIVFATLLVLISLPAMAVVVFAQSGLTLISEALATVNPVTHQVEIHDPNGKTVADFTATTVWPVNGVVTLEFGQPDPPYQTSHTGIDIANRHQLIGDPITTFMDGKVFKTDPQGLGGCGKYVEIDHGNNVVSLYCHMSLVLATKDQQVKPGDIIGLEGSTGNSTGPHVHFQIMVYGIPVNPRTFMVGNPDPGP